MDYREKHAVAQQLQDNRYIEQDRALLRKYQPHSSLMCRSIAMRNGESLSFEILYLLLDFATPQEIMANRQVQTAGTSYRAQVEQAFTTDKKKGLPSMRSSQESIGKILRTLLFKKRS